MQILYYLNRDRESREKEDDPLLDRYFYIQDNNNLKKDIDNITILYNNGNIKYIGPLKNFKAEGKGKYYSKDYKNIIIYDGNFKKGFANGIGTRYYYEGMNKVGYYIGTWIDSKRNGNGEMHYSNGDYYKGNFKDDIKEGKGIYYYNDGDYYDGEFRNDERHGEGKVCKSNNEIRCEGFFKKNEYQTTKWEWIKSFVSSKPHCY